MSERNSLNFINENSWLVIRFIPLHITERAPKIFYTRNSDHLTVMFILDGFKRIPLALPWRERRRLTGSISIGAREVAFHVGLIITFCWKVLEEDLQSNKIISWRKSRVIQWMKYLINVFRSDHSSKFNKNIVNLITFECTYKCLCSPTSLPHLQLVSQIFLLVLLSITNAN